MTDMRPVNSGEQAATRPLLTEFPLTPQEFTRIRELVYRHCRIALNPGKEGLVRSRLAKFLRSMRLESYDAYLDYVEADRTGAALSLFIDTLTTNKTNFFRENAHFEFLRSTVLPGLATSGSQIRIWSAGCSSGEEPYTLSMLLHEEMPNLVRRDVRILATDISSRVLELAEAAEYPAATVRDIPATLVSRYMQAVPRNGGHMYRMSDTVRAPIKFARLNLMAQWPMRQPFQVIFCRNVMIYFDRPTQQQLVQRFYDALAPGGYLFVGHSESLSAHKHAFRSVRPAIYVK